MEKEYFSLELRDNNKFTRIIQGLFGVICLAIAVYWLIYTSGAGKADWTTWATVIFLTGFAVYQLLTSLGKSERFIEINNGKLRLKKDSILPPVVFSNEDLSEVEFYPLKVVFSMKNMKKKIFRLGIAEPDKAERIKESIMAFCERNNISFRIVTEE
ncbi:MAG: hypothetical protein U0X39_09420 [Bacteroidales bacterium]